MFVLETRTLIFISIANSHARSYLNISISISILSTILALFILGLGESVLRCPAILLFYRVVSGFE